MTVQRRFSHRRSIDICGYVRDDGLYDIEAKLIDIKGIPSTTPDRPDIPAGEELHNLGLCLTIDSGMTIREVSASMDATPYVSCAEVAEAYQKLVGVNVGAGWTRKVKELFSGVKGCTHLREILGQMATVCFQTVVDEEWRTKDYRESAEGFGAMIGSCYGLDPEGENVKKIWPDLIKEVS